MLRQISSTLVVMKVIMGVHYRTYSPPKLKPQKQLERLLCEWISNPYTYAHMHERKNVNISTKTNISTGCEWTQTRELAVALTNLSLNQRRESVHLRLALLALRVDQTPINTNNHLQRQRLVWESGCRDETIINKTNKRSSSYRPGWCQ